MRIDLNCDMGEGFGAYRIGNDDAILDVVTSANIACGFHAGDPHTMRETVKMALEKGISIGAHPGFPDLNGFGRRSMDLSPQEVYDIVLYQIGALSTFVQAEGGRMHHVKPHGALYNMAAKSQPLSEAIAAATHDVNPKLLLFGLSGGKLLEAGERFGLKTVAEVFADRTYQSDGSLTPRTHPNALILDNESAVTQVIQMIRDGKVHTEQGQNIAIKADTVCVHGDSPNALHLARKIRAELIEAGVNIQNPSC